MTLAIRRSLSLLVALALAVAIPVAMTGHTTAWATPKPVKAALRTHALHELPATARAHPGAAPQRVAASDTVDLGGRAHVVGVTWPEGTVARDAAVQLREKRGGGWGPWQPLSTDPEEGPDPGSVPAGEVVRGGTAPYVSTADAVQVRVLSDTAAQGRAARLDVVDATVTAADAAVGASPAGSASAQASRPTIYTRADWGADESIRHAIVAEGVIKTAIVHHTDGSNSYTSAEVPSIIRGIYVFHTVSRGWGDIGYNFLVDRFGRTWEGRWGGITRPMVGAHALGFNSQSFGVSVMGDFTSVTPPSAVPTALSKLIAWKLGLENIDPTATTYLDGKGTAPTVIGHRDVNQTACPGAKLYAELGSIRTRARQYQGTMVYSPSISRTSYTYGGAGATVSGRASTDLTWRLTVTSVCSTTPQAVVTGTTSAGSTVRAAWNGRDDAGRLVPPGRYTVRLSASNGTGTRATALSSAWALTVGDAPGAPPGYCPPRLGGPNRFAVAVATSQENDPTSTHVVLANGWQNAMADALVAAPLARSRGAVLLLTGASGLPSATRAEIIRRGVTDVTIVGGTASVSQDVVTELTSLGVQTVDRVDGKDRYEVAANVARLIAGGAPVPDVLVASGDQRALADGLALSGPATALGRPIVLVSASGIPAPTAAALQDLEVQHTVVAGGPVTVPDDVMAQLPSATRLGGDTRYDVSANIAAWAKTVGVPTSSVLVASGYTEKLADTLSGGQLGRPTLYVRENSVPAGVMAWLDGEADLTLVTVMGGEVTVPALTAGKVQQAVLR